MDIEQSLHDDFKRLAIELLDDDTQDDEWNWNSYFLMQHHGGPTRLLDWSDGALMALHFAVRNKKDDSEDALVYVLEPYRLDDQIDALPEIQDAKTTWKEHVATHRSEKLSEDEWENSYLPDYDHVPKAPLLLHFPHITRRIAAQRSRFMVFGADYDWLAAQHESPDFPIKALTIDAASRGNIRQELRDSGVTESVIFPDLDGLGRETQQLWEDLK